MSALLPHQVDLAIEVAQERAYPLLQAIGRLFMVNVSDETAQKALAERESSVERLESPIEKARRVFYEDLLLPSTPQWRVEARSVEATEEPEEPIEGLDPRVAAALLEAYREDSASLPEAVRQPMYVVMGRLVATAELSGNPG